MVPLFVTIFLASLIGSLHCAGMCGAFLAFAIGVGDPAIRVSRGLLQAAYHLGRLITYVALGALAGGLGSALDLAGRFVGLQRAAAVGAGAMMIAFGALTLLRVLRVKMGPLPVPALLTTLATAGHRSTMRRGPLARAAITGLLTTLLPCGWLYAFVITAAGTAHPLTGALAMLAFWIGTLPMLAAVGAGMQFLAKPLAARLPAVTATAIVLVGLYTLCTRASLATPLMEWTRKHETARVTTPVSEGKSSESRIGKSELTVDLPCCTRPATLEAAP